jgi:hypothetical protein
MLRAAATLAVALLLVGCGDADSAAEPTGSPGLFGADVTAARPGVTPRELVVTLDVPAGHRACATAPAATVEQSEQTVWVQTTITSVTGEYKVCPERAPMEFRVAIPPLRGRALVINQRAWELSAEGGYALCSEVLGCDPPEDRCDRAWVNALLAGVELPPERSVDIVACDGRWLVLDVDAVVTGCQPVDGSTPPSGCTGSGTHRRWFARLDDQRMWDVIASGTDGGCAEVHAKVPEFPARLCSELPAR